MKKELSVFMITFFLAGCAANNPEELERLTKEDPNFRQMIATRDKMRSDVKLIKEDLLVKKRAVDAQVEKMRGDYDAYAKSQNIKIEKYKTGLEVYRKALAKDIDQATVSMETKQNELAGYEKTLRDVQKVLHESKGITLSAQEKEKWKERVLLLNEKMRPLSEEIQDLKLKIRLNKRKIGFLN